MHRVQYQLSLLPTWGNKIAGEEGDWKYDSSDEDYSYEEYSDGKVVKRNSRFPRYNNDTEIPHFSLFS